MKKILLGFFIYIFSFNLVLANSKDLKYAYLSYLRGLLYIYDQDYNSALSELKKASKLDPESIDIRFTISALLLYLNKIELAEKELSYIKRIDPENIEASSALLFIYAYLKKDKKLEDEYEYLLKRLINLKKDNKFKEQLAQFYFYKNKFKSALELYDEILKENPNYLDALLWKSYIYEKLNRKDEAIWILKKGLEINPNYAPILNSLGYLYAEDGIFLDEAEVMVKKALNAEPENGAYIDSLGWIYFKKKDYKKAEEYLKKAISLTKDPVIYEHLGDLYIELKNEEEAKRYYLEGLKDFPDNKTLKEKLKTYGGKNKSLKD